MGEVSHTPDLLSLLIKTRWFENRENVLQAEMQLIPNLYGQEVKPVSDPSP